MSTCTISEHGRWSDDDAVGFVGAALGLPGQSSAGENTDGAARALDAVPTALRAHERPDGLCFARTAWLVTAERP